MADASRVRLPAPERRSQLLDAALASFGPRGFHRTSMDDIAELAGVTKPVLYQHFASKHELYVELLHRVSGELLDSLEAAATREETPFGRLLSGFRAYFAFVSQRTSAFELLFGAGAQRTPEFAGVIREVEQRAAAAIAEFIDADIESEHRTLLGYAIVGAAEMASRQWVIGAGPALDAAEGDRLAQQLSDSRVGRASGPAAPALGSPAVPTSHRVPPNCDLILGIVCVDKTTPGVTVWQMEADERFANPAGVIQGGFLSAFADSAMATATVTALQGRKVYAANAELKISFLKPAQAGGTLTCTARVISSGRRVTFVEAEVVNDAGLMVAKASSTYLLADRA